MGNLDKTDPLLACERTISLLKRIWPALQSVDTSSGALSTAVWNAIDTLHPLALAIFHPAQVDGAAIQEDGVDYLSQCFWTDRDTSGKVRFADPVRAHAEDVGRLPTRIVRRSSRT